MGKGGRRFSSNWKFKSAQYYSFNFHNNKIFINFLSLSFFLWLGSRTWVVKVFVFKAREHEAWHNCIQFSALLCKKMTTLDGPCEVSAMSCTSIRPLIATQYIQCFHCHYHLKLVNNSLPSEVYGLMEYKFLISLILYTMHLVQQCIRHQAITNIKYYLQ